MQKLEQELSKYKITLNEQELSQLAKYHKLYTKYVRIKDLSRIYDFKNIVKKHYADSLLVNKFFHFKSIDTVLDIGTGAGFPGMILAITNKNTEFLLAEPRPKRVDFLKLVIKELRLNNASVLPVKIVKGLKLDKTPNIVITRALEDMAYTLERVKDIVDTGSKVIFMKGPNYQDDVEKAKQLSYIFRLLSIKDYKLTSRDKRSLIVYEKLLF